MNVSAIFYWGSILMEEESPRKCITHSSVQKIRKNEGSQGSILTRKESPGSMQPRHAFDQQGEVMQSIEIGYLVYHAKLRCTQKSYSRNNQTSNSMKEKSHSLISTRPGIDHTSLLRMEFKLSFLHRLSPLRIKIPLTSQLRDGFIPYHE